MALRLGEVLVQNNIIDTGQLKDALDAQLIYGGHLGTCLVELGYVDVDVLARVLSEQFSVAHADREGILKIAPEVIETLPEPLVIKHEAIPFKLTERVLHVAMVNPENLVALDELSFAAGYRVEAWIAPEILIHRAMEHYYKIPRKLRHIAVSSQPGRPRPQSPTPVPTVMEYPDSEPNGSDERFVAQKRPSIHTRVEQEQGIQIGEARDGKLTVNWIKRKHGEAQQWCELFDVPLSNPHFNEAAGVYVIWHNGHNPVLRVGQGYIRTELKTLQLDSGLRAIAADSPVFVSWAHIAREHRDMVERYLVDMLGPQHVIDVPEVAPIEVNLPC